MKELGTRKYNIKINNKYFVRFEEIEDNRGKGFLKDIRLGFPINYCPQCRKEVVVCHI